MFPLLPGGKTQATQRGFKNATTDPRVIRAWWTADPMRNIGIATGHPGIDALDVEGDKKPGGSGWPAHEKLADAGLLAGACMVVTTPSGGIHLYFTGTSQANGSLGKHHVDFRSTGGYVVAAPSFVFTDDYAGSYEVTEERECAGQLDWNAVKALLAGPEIRRTPQARKTPGDSTALARWVCRLPEGQRNSGLFWAACRCVEQGADPTGLLEAAMQSGLPEAEARRTIESALRKVR